MSSLTGKTIASSYDQILITDNDGGITGTETTSTQIICGTGVAGIGNTLTTPLHLSRDWVGIGAIPAELLTVESPTMDADAGANANKCILAIVDGSDASGTSQCDARLKFGRTLGGNQRYQSIGMHANSNDMHIELDITNGGDSGLAIEVDTTDVFHILNNGNVGIGTVLPGQLLDIQTSNGSHNGMRFKKESIDATHISFSFSHRSTNKDFLLYGYDGGDVGYKNFLHCYYDTGYTIFNAGKVGIGTASPAANLEIESSGAFYSGTPTLLVQDTSNRGTIILESTTDQETDFMFKNNSRYSWVISSRDSAGNYNLQFYASANGSSFVIEGDWDTDTGVFAADFNDTSDVGLKENIVNLSNGITKVLALKPRTFDWKRSAKGSNTGFIAQEVETVLPNDVSGEDWTEENPDIWKSINTQGIVAVCVKAIQELSAKVTALENA